MLDCKWLCWEKKIIIKCQQENVTIRVRQLLPIHPLTQSQVLGAIHHLLVEHGGLQIAVLRLNNLSTWRHSHTCWAVTAFPSTLTCTSVRSYAFFVIATWKTANCYKLIYYVIICFISIKIYYVDSLEKDHNLYNISIADDKLFDKLLYSEFYLKKYIFIIV